MIQAESSKLLGVTLLPDNICLGAVFVFCCMFKRLEKLCVEDKKQGVEGSKYMVRLNNRTSESI